MLKILNDIYTVANNGFPTCLVALDLISSVRIFDRGKIVGIASQFAMHFWVNANHFHFV